MKYTGCLTALITPFTADLEVDYNSFTQFLNWQKDQGVSAVVVAGSTGEGATLSEDEYRELIILAKKSGLSVMAAVNSSVTSHAVHLAEIAKSAGAESLLVTAPPYNKPPQQGIALHISRVKEATGLPIIAYNVPGRSAIAIQPGTLANLYRDKVIEGVKEASGSIDYSLDIFSAVSDKKFSVLAGDDSLLLPLLACGGTGAISASGNVLAKEMIAICSNFESGRIEQARETQLSILPKIRALFLESNPIPVKYIVWKMGKIATPELREPLIQPSVETQKKLDQIFGL